MVFVDLAKHKDNKKKFLETKKQDVIYYIFNTKSKEQYIYTHILCKEELTFLSPITFFFTGCSYGSHFLEVDFSVVKRRMGFALFYA